MFLSKKRYLVPEDSQGEGREEILQRREDVAEILKRGRSRSRRNTALSDAERPVRRERRSRTRPDQLSSTSGSSTEQEKIPNLLTTPFGETNHADAVAQVAHQDLYRIGSHAWAGLGCCLTELLVCILVVQFALSIKSHFQHARKESNI
jgi:hypothetical protein